MYVRFACSTQCVLTERERERERKREREFMWDVWDIKRITFLYKMTLLGRLSISIFHKQNAHVSRNFLPLSSSSTQEIWKFHIINFQILTNRYMCILWSEQQIYKHITREISVRKSSWILFRCLSKSILVQNKSSMISNHTIHDPHLLSKRKTSFHCQKTLYGLCTLLLLKRLEIFLLVDKS